MKSLRQLREELLGIRMDALSTSLWYQGATIVERADRAINDAIMTYQYQTQAVFNSLTLGEEPTVMVLPYDVGRIVSIEAVGDTGGRRRKVTDYRHVPTSTTNLLYLDETAHVFFSGNYVPIQSLEMVYEVAVYELPADMVLPAGVSGFVACTGMDPQARGFKAPGFLELSVNTTGFKRREVIRYDMVSSTAGIGGRFDTLTRGVEGNVHQWAAADNASACYQGPDSMLPVIMAKAQATMYEFWLRNRALYEQYTAIVSEQAVDVGTLLGLSRAMEDKADRAFKRIKRPPSPTQARSRIRRG